MKRRIDHYASFKDPAAKVFNVVDDETSIYRQLNPEYLTHYNHFKSSGLSQELIKKNYLVPFEEMEGKEGNVILKARKVPFVAFPYEWTFNQWKDAALLTLKIQFQALSFGMTLKDATPFNVVFDGSRPLFIDISSFEIYKEGQPWLAFKQFCENFYLPILLLKYFDGAGNDIYQNNSNGISLSKGLSLLPAKAFLNFNTLFFLALPGNIRQRLDGKSSSKSSGKFTIKTSLDFTNQLFDNINKLKQAKQQTKWNDYYDNNIDHTYLAEKERLVKEWIGDSYANKTLVDFGCNTGNFSKLAAPFVQSVIAFDEDMRSAEELYGYSKAHKIGNLFSFTANLSQPTPATGWCNMERPALKDRLRGDIGLVLALIHHLAISNHIPFTMMADFFASTCKELFIEFVPKEDAKVQLLLANRQDIFDWYNLENFKASFKVKFSLQKEYCFSNNRVLFHFIIRENEQ